jgi:anti-anti-sigma factor
MRGRDDVVVVEHAGPVRIVSLRGEHDADTNPILHAALGEAVASVDPIVVDLTSCTFIESTCIAELVHAGQSTSPGRFAVVVASDSEAGRLLDLVAFSALLPVYEGRDEAITAVST